MDANTFFYIVVGITLAAGLALVWMTRRYRNRVRGPSREQCREWRTDIRSHEPYRVLVGTVKARDGQEADLLIEAGREGTTCAHRVPCRFIIRTPEGDEGIGYSENEAADDLFDKRPDLRPT